MDCWFFYYKKPKEIIKPLGYSYGKNRQDAWETLCLLKNRSNSTSNIISCKFGDNKYIRMEK